jgi:hypothetical protein
VSGRPNPRKNADDAYAAFMSMSESEWLGLLRSLLGSDGVPGGCLEIEEQKGFDRALLDRAIARRRPGIVP